MCGVILSSSENDADSTYVLLPASKDQLLDHKGSPYESWVPFSSKINAYSTDYPLSPSEGYNDCFFQTLPTFSDKDFPEKCDSKFLYQATNRITQNCLHIARESVALDLFFSIFFLWKDSEKRLC